MALTTYGPSSGGLTGTAAIAGSPTMYAITGYSYTNPNLTVTTSTPHGFQVGNIVAIQGITATAPIPNTSSAIITAVTSNTFTYNYGATAPGAYGSGGWVWYTTNGMITTNVTLGKYVNGFYIFAGRYGTFAYSSDGINWNWNQLPVNGTSIYPTGVDFDGTYYIFCADADANVYRATSLGGQFQAVAHNLGVTTAADIVWCGGSINRWVVVAGTTAVSSGALSIASAGGAAFSLQTITGTNSNGFTSVAFDGASTIIVCQGNGTGSSGYVYSTNGTTWTGVAGDGTLFSNASPGLATTTAPTFIGWNPIESRFFGWNNSQILTTATPATATAAGAWFTTGSRVFNYDNMYSLNGNVAPQTNTYNKGVLQIDAANSRFISIYRQDGSNWLFTSFDLQPTPLTIFGSSTRFATYLRKRSDAIEFSPGAPLSDGLASSVGLRGLTRGYITIYGNGKFVNLQYYGSAGSSSNYQFVASVFA